MTFIKNTAENQYLNSRDNFILELLDNTAVLEIDYESDSVAQTSLFCIKFNGVVVDEFKIKKEKNRLVLNLPVGTGEQTLELSMTGKGPNDTLVENGIIVKDTFLKLLDLKINNYELLSDYEFFLNKTEYQKHHTNEKLRPMDGFWEDATLKIKFDLPFDLWYNSISTKNAAISESLKFRAANNLDSLIENLEQNLKKLI